MAITTADHVIEPVDTFQASVRTAFDVTADDPAALVAFASSPRTGHTGLGYVHRGEPLMVKGKPGAAYRVLGFKEEARQADGRPVRRVGPLLLEQRDVRLAVRHRAERAGRAPARVAQGLSQIAAAWDTPRRDAVLNEVYPALKKISIDYAVMEPASQNKGKAHVTVVEMPVQWLDVGSWPALAETLKTDEHNNAAECPVQVLLDSDDNIIVCDDPAHLVSTIGVSDMIVVHTRDATLVCPKSEAQRVKDLVGRVKEKYGERYM
jgi:mannose-1-phosphate guanylyltransferase